MFPKSLNYRKSSIWWQVSTVSTGKYELSSFRYHFPSLVLNRKELIVIPYLSMVHYKIGGSGGMLVCGSDIFSSEVVSVETKITFIFTIGNGT
jgi:hypothetical protein